MGPQQSSTELAAIGHTRKSADLLGGLAQEVADVKGAAEVQRQAIIVNGAEGNADLGDGRLVAAALLHVQADHTHYLLDAERSLLQVWAACTPTKTHHTASREGALEEKKTSLGSNEPLEFLLQSVVC